jgi:hypothetical protein
MQINGLEREERTIAGNDEPMTGGILPSDPHEQLRSAGFRRILLVVNALGGIPAALNTACVLVDRALGEIVPLEAASEAWGAPSLTGHADWMNRPIDIDLLEIHRPSLNAASINQVAQEYRCDLVILMMESQGNEFRIVRGCVTEEIFRRLRCPTVVLGPKVPRLPSAGPGDGPVIFATSFQDRNMAAIGLASRVANLCGSSLECAHVLPADMADTAKGCHIVPQIMRDALVAGAKQNHVWLRPEQCHILYGHSVSYAVARFAELRKARFLVLGVQQAGAPVSHLPVGITSSTILSATCPVLTLASHG